MTKDEKIFEMGKALAPEFARRMLDMQQRIVDMGKDPSKCTVDGKSIAEYYAWENAYYAQMFVNMIDKSLQL